ncbi:MAG: hypothetical protein J6B55_04140, partial [Clostridia bacterium]|nr:hypothetical protein [Clostridia bacterium]
SRRGEGGLPHCMHGLYFAQVNIKIRFDYSHFYDHGFRFESLPFFGNWGWFCSAKSMAFSHLKAHFASEMPKP